MKAAPSAIPPQWAWHYRTLLKLRSALLDEHLALSAAACRPHEPAADLADVASDETEHDTLMAELSHEDAQLAEVEAALERLRNGTYGRCELTGEAIAPQRLRAIPWTRFSRPAAERRERKKA